MKKNVLSILGVALLLIGCNDQSSSSSYQSRESSLYSAPLAPELTETFRQGKDHGHALGSALKDAFE